MWPLSLQVCQLSMVVPQLLSVRALPIPTLLHQQGGCLTGTYKKLTDRTVLYSSFFLLKNPKVALTAADRSVGHMWLAIVQEGLHWSRLRPAVQASTPGTALPCCMSVRAVTEDCALEFTAFGVTHHSS
jgi:hypothetical protein